MSSSETPFLEQAKKVALLLGPALAILLPLFMQNSEHPKAPFMLGIALWMAIWWMSECVPLAVTALIPLFAFPLLGIATAKETAPRYMGSTIFLFMGGFLIAQAMENTGLHRRIALFILARWHQSLTHIFMGFAGVTAFLSMWISNTATTMLMLTIALSVLSRLESQLKEHEKTQFATVLLLGIAYAANIGGLGTPVGSPPNLVFLETINNIAPELTPSFLQWMTIGLPLALMGLFVLYLLLGRSLSQLSWAPPKDNVFESEKMALGPISAEEKKVGLVLVITALSWMTRKGIQGGSWSLPGWSALLPYPGIDDATVAIAAAFSLFLLKTGSGQRILKSDAFSRLPWSILILFGGGFAMAMGMKNSGLSAIIGQNMAFLTTIPPVLMMLGIALIITFLTEITSNTATTQILLPILAAISIGNQQDPTLLMLTATLSASCAFMLPVATPPNAIVFGSNRIPMQAMLRKGLQLNLVMALLIVAVVSLLRGLFP